MSKTYIATTAEQLGARQSFLKDVKIGVDINTIITPGDYIVAGNDGTPSAAENQAVNLPDEAGYFALLVNATLHYNGINGCSQIAINRDTGTVYSRANRNDVWTDWIELADAANFLPLNGSAAMKGNVVFPADRGIIREVSGSAWQEVNFQENGAIRFLVRKENKNRMLYLSPYGVDINYALRFWWYDDENEHSAAIFGEHNTSLLAKAVEKEIQNGGLSTLDNAIQAYTGDAKNGVDFSVTGKGRIFLSNNGVSILKPTITVDGKSIGNVSVVGSGSSIYVEFLNSCKVIHPSTDILKCTAVCY